MSQATLISKRHRGAASPAPAHPEAAPVPNRLLTPGVKVLLGIMAIGLSFALARFVSGLSAVTHLTDQYPWGIWIAVDVATGVALAAGGFTTAALVHIFHKEHYEVVVRPALLTALLGYTFVVLGLLVDLGRYYNVWHPMVPSMWSGHSVLFEVGICVMFYLTVLYIEFLPLVLERIRGRVNLPGGLSGLNRAVETGLALADRTLGRVIWIFVVLGVVLSCLHQSSLGGLMVLAQTKMHPLWWTPILPLLFLLSAVAVGFPMVIFESMIASRALGRKSELHILSPLARIIPVILFVYLAFKLGDLTLRNAWGYVLEGSVQSWVFLIEIGLGVVTPMILLTRDRWRRSPPVLFTAATLVVAGVAMNRIDVFLVAYRPLYADKPYFPSIGEIAVTVGLIAGLVFMYRVLITLFPVLPREEEA